MTNLILIAVLLAIIGFAVGYIIKAKKKGHKCIGCPSGGCGEHSCDHGCGGCCGSSCDGK